MTEPTKKPRLICLRQLMNQKDKAVCDNCKSKCVQEVKNDK